MIKPNEDQKVIIFLLDKLKTKCSVREIREIQEELKILGCFYDEVDEELPEFIKQ